MTAPSSENLSAEGVTSMKGLPLFLDIVGASALVLGAFAVWPPLALFTLGALALIASWRLSS